MTSLLFGSLSTLADTSELQRWAFNQAFVEHGLDWSWDRDDYRRMLEGNGGADRIRAYADQRGESVDADAVHATKSETFRARLRADGAEPRPGVVETISAATSLGMRVGLVTTTSADNLDALFDALAPAVRREDFAVVLDATAVEVPKPDPAVYAKALAELGEQPEACVAVEDNIGGVTAATVAGLRVLAFPNANTAGHEFPGAEKTVDTLDAGDVTAILEG